MKFQLVNHGWPINGGAMLIPTGTMLMASTGNLAGRGSPYAAASECLSYGSRGLRRTAKTLSREPHPHRGREHQHRGMERWSKSKQPNLPRRFLVNCSTTSQAAVSSPP